MADDIQNPDINAEFEKALGPSAAAQQAPPDAAAMGTDPVQQQAGMAAPAEAPSPDAAASVVNVINPMGKVVGIPHSQLQEAIESGYQVASNEDVHKHFNEEKYGSPLEQLKTGLEGAASSATFGLSTGLERAAGVDPEDIRGREEANPLAHGVGQVAGLVGSSFLVPGGGAAGVLDAAGEAGVRALGLGAAESTVAKLGSAAVKGAIENMTFQGGVEADKILRGDPMTLSSSMADIGLSGLIGGAFGAGMQGVKGLWQSTMGGQTAGVLGAVARKAGGIEGAVPNEIGDALNRAGIEISPEVQASLSNDPYVKQMAQTLMDSATGSGIKMQEALRTAKGQLGDAMVGALGKTPEEVEALQHMSDFDAGNELKQSLTKQLKETIEPISEKFEAIKDKYKSIDLAPETKAELTEKLGQIASDTLDDRQRSLINNTIEKVATLKNLEGIRNLGSAVGKSSKNGDLAYVGGVVSRALREVEDSVVNKAVEGEGSAELLAQHAQARASYRQSMTTMDALNDRLHVGHYNGPSSFIKALNEMTPEDVLRRLSPKGDAGIIGELTTKFPEAASKLKDYHLNQLLKQASFRAGDGQTINSNTLLKAITEKMSPEMRNFIVPPEAMSKLEDIKSVIDAFPEKVGKSGTPQGLDALMSNIPGSAVGMASALMGHGPITSILAGKMTQLLGRDAPDAARLGLLKFLGSNKEISSGGFKSMVDFIHHTMAGESLINRGVSNIFKAGKEVLPASQMPTQSDRNKLDKQLKTLQSGNQSALYDVGTHTAHYMPEAGAAMAQTAASASSYLNSLRPVSQKMSPLDRALPPSASTKARFDRALDIAQQPAVILHHIRQGTLQANDLIDLKSMYPAVYANFAKKLNDQMVTTLDKDQPIPYKARMSLSLFLGQPLDSTMTPMAIQSAQPQPPQGQPATSQTPQSNPKHSMNSLNKVGQGYQTATQSRQAAREGREQG